MQPAFLSQLEPGPVLRWGHGAEQYQHCDDGAAGHPRPVRRGRLRAVTPGSAQDFDV